MNEDNSERPEQPWSSVADLVPAEASDVGDLFPAATRRTFLKMLSAGAAASLAACTRLPVKEAMPLLVPAEDLTPGVPARYASTCLACPAACGLIALVRDGRPVKLEGDPAHPRSAGGLCATGQAEVRALYDASRPRGPMIAGKPVTWDELDRRVGEALAATQGSGKGLAVLTPILSSPSERAAVSALLVRFPGMWVEHDLGPGTVAAVAEAYVRLDGLARVPALDLRAADVWLALASDELGTGPDPVAHTYQWSERRRAATTRGLLRHVQIESTLSLTGANADERWQHTAAERRTLALWLLRRVATERGGERGVAIAAALGALPEPGAGAAKAEALGRELLAAGPRALVTSGSADVDEQAAVALINRLLGAEGTTLDLVGGQGFDGGRDRELSSLLEAVHAQRVGALVIVASDPVGLLPRGAELASSMAKLPLTVVIDDQESATSRAATAVAAAHHGLERWAERAPWPGLHTLAQPATRPLHDTRDPFDCLRRWAGKAELDARGVLEASWRERALLDAGADWTGLWQTTVMTAGLGTREAFAPANGVGAGSRTPPDDAWLARAAAKAAVKQDVGSIEVEVIREVAMGDGRRAHLPWLRELPDPLTRAAWTACARVAPSLARSLGVVDGDLVALHAESGGVTLPVRIAPGQHPAVIGVPRGYGRAGGDPEDWNAARLMKWSDGRIAADGLGVRVEVTGRKLVLPLMQTESLTHGRPIVHQLHGLDEKVDRESVAGNGMWPEAVVSSPKWEMVIDLDACTGCSACVVACQAENNIPVVGPRAMARNIDMYWLRIDRYYVGDESAPDVLFEPMLCAQCGNAPCETVCPVAATVHSVDGLNQQVYNRCVGTRYCANNCPYKVRRFNWFENAPTDPLERMVLNPDVVVRSRGVMEKCTFCVQRIQAARIASRQGEGGDFTVTTACEGSCPAHAIRFGDATLTGGAIGEAKDRPNAFQVLGELGTRPAVTYLARRRNRAWPAAGGREQGHGPGKEA